jgi:hypothetical protein
MRSRQAASASASGAASGAASAAVSEAASGEDSEAATGVVSRTGVSGQRDYSQQCRRHRRWDVLGPLEVRRTGVRLQGHR